MVAENDAERKLVWYIAMTLVGLLGIGAIFRPKFRYACMTLSTWLAIIWGVSIARSIAVEVRENDFDLQSFQLLLFGFLLVGSFIANAMLPNWLRASGANPFPYGSSVSS
jgi:hypothetical protein